MERSGISSWCRNTHDDLNVMIATMVGRTPPIQVRSCRQRDLDHTDHFGLSHLQQAFHPRIQVCPEVGAGGGKALEKAAWGAAFQGGLPECLLRRRRGTFRIRGVPCFMPAVDLVLGSTVGSFLQSAASPQILLFHREVPCHEFLPISAAALLRSPLSQEIPQQRDSAESIIPLQFWRNPRKNAAELRQRGWLHPNGRILQYNRGEG